MTTDNGSSGEEGLTHIRMNRRKALSTGAKVGVAAGVAAIVAGAGAYFAGVSTAPVPIQRTVTQEVVRTVTAPAQTVTQTVMAEPVKKPAVTLPIKELRFRHWFDLTQKSSRADAYNFAINSFKETFKVDVKVEITPYDKIDTKWIADIQAGVAPDVSLTSPQNNPTHYKAKSLYPLKEYLDQLTPAEKKDLELSNLVINEYATGGQIIMLPVEIHTRAIFFRKDIFEALGLKDISSKLETAGVRDIDELKDIARKVKEKSKGTNPITQKELYAGLFHAQDVRALTDPYFTAVFWTFGGRLYESPLGKAAWHEGDAGVKAAKHMVSYFAEGLTPPDMITATTADARKQVVDGRLALWIDGNYALPYFRANGMNEKNFGIFKFPGKMFTNSWSIGMNPQVPKERRDAAWVFIKNWIIDRAPEFFVTYGSAIPTTYSALARPELETGTTGYYFKVLKDVTLNHARSTQHERYQELLDTIGPVLQRLMAEKVADEKEIQSRLASAAKVFNDKFYG